MFRRIKLAVTGVMLCVLSACGGGDDTPTTATESSTDGAASAAALSEPTRTLFDAAAIESNQDAWIDSAAADPKDPMHRFALVAKDVGGIRTLNRMMAAGQVSELRPLFSNRGIGITDLRKQETDDEMRIASAKREALPGPLDSAQCIPFYAKADADHTYFYPTQTVYIDPLGRPGYAQWMATPAAVLKPTPRTACQTLVGKWGLPDDDGGHLIAAALSGWGYRANMVPENLNLNRGAWRTVESVPVFCQKVLVTQYNVRPLYVTGGVRPERLNAVVVVVNHAALPVSIADINAPNTAASEETKAAVSAFYSLATLKCTAISRM